MSDRGRGGGERGNTEKKKAIDREDTAEKMRGVPEEHIRVWEIGHSRSEL